MTRHGLRLGEDAGEGGGIRTRVGRLVGRRRNVSAELVSRLKQLVRHPTDEERLALYRKLQNEDVLPNVDAVIERVVRDRDLLAAITPHARWLVREARHRGPLKFGIALLGVSGEPSDAELMKELASHDEFTLYCLVALQNLMAADPTDALWEVAKRAGGWGKIEAVERLVPLVSDRPDIKRWLLTDGCENSVMNEYLGYACATGGGLADAIRGDVDDALLDGACTIVSALCTGGPAEDLDDYLDGPAVIERLLALLENRCQDLDRLETVVDVLEWLDDESPGDLPPEVDAQEYARERAARRDRQSEHGWNDQLKADLVERCRSILRRPHWPERLQQGFDRGGRQGQWVAWRVAPLVGVDLWDAGFAKLERDPLDEGLVFKLMHSHDRARQLRIVDWAEEHLLVEKIATGPADHLFPAEHREIDGALTFIIQEMRDGDLYSERLVASALLAPVVGTRNQALNAVEPQPREKWGSSVESALHRVAGEDPDDEVRARAAGLLARS